MNIYSTFQLGKVTNEVVFTPILHLGKTFLMKTGAPELGGQDGNLPTKFLYKIISISNYTSYFLGLIKHPLFYIELHTVNSLLTTAK